MSIDEPSKYTLTIRGTMATHLREVHCLAFTKLLETDAFLSLSTKQLIAIFSCFTNVKVSDDNRSPGPPATDTKITAILKKVVDYYEDYQDFESANQMNTGIDYEMHYDLIEYVNEWTESFTSTACKAVLQRLEEEKGIFLGDFVKAIMKINNISSEMERVAEMVGNIEFLHKLKDVPKLTLKYVVTNQSLYI